MANVNLDINIHHVTRVEGHGDITVNVNSGKIEKCEWSVVEAPRFFEAMVRGRNWKELHHITSRICGICSIGHTLASVRATENAMGINVSEQDIKLRRMALHAENLQSHILHIGYLALPDLMGTGSVIPLASSHPEELKTVIRLHRLANEMSDLICGRTTHPQSMIPGGFGKIPTLDQLKELRERLESYRDDLNTAAKLMHDLLPKIPKFERETEYIGLVSDGDEYPLYRGKIGSTDTDPIPEEDYLSYTNEYIVPQSTAKYTKNKRDSLMVGALARVNLNYDKLSDNAKEVAKLMGLEPICCNPYMNTYAQLVEVADAFDDATRLADELIAGDYKYHRPEVTPSAGRGAAAVEVPRGILIHDYTYDENGVCKEANCVIPTNQNHGNIQLDMEKLVPTILDKSRDEISLMLEMLVRAYDPCISCSTHYTNVKFVD